MKFTARFSRWSVLAAAALVVAIGLDSNQPILAQNGGPRRPSINVQAFNACTTTDYAALIAKALNISASMVRQDIVNGQTLQSIISAAGVDPQIVLTAYQTARKADIDQAAKDGVITQDEANTLEATPVAAASTPAATAPARPAGQGAPGGQNAAQFPDISNLNYLLKQISGTPATANAGGFGGGGIGLGIGANTFNLVKQYAVAAQALNMKCADLVKTLITPPGQSISMVAAAQNIDPKTISAALTKAYADALTQDVTDGLITQSQSDQLAPLVTQAVTLFVSNPLPMGPQGTPKPQS